MLKAKITKSFLWRHIQDSGTALIGELAKSGGFSAGLLWLNDAQPLFKQAACLGNRLLTSPHKIHIM